MKTKRGPILFLLASFISSLGDYVLLFSVPAGLGLETGDVRSAVSMWLIPAVAMYLSSFLSRFIAKRHLTSRSDLGKLYIGIGLLEIAFAVLAIFATGKLQILMTVCFFVFFYAFAKEGIPKLFYMVSIYKYFVKPAEYSKLASTNSGLSVLASILGTLLAGGLLAAGNWKLGLLIDAVTFFIFGTIVILFGSDVKQEEILAEKLAESNLDLDTPKALNMVFLVLPLFFFINALSWNYLPLVVDSLDIATVSNSIYLIALLRVPGLVMGLRYTNMLGHFKNSYIISGVGFLYFSSILLFLLKPSQETFALTILAQGLFSGVYWPADLSVRNRLESGPQIMFNTAVLKALSSFQFIGCLLALLLFANPQNTFSLLPGVIIGSGLLIVLFQSYRWRQVRVNLGIILSESGR